MKRSFLRRDLLRIYRLIEVLNSTNDEISFEFSYALIKNKYKIKSIVDETEEKLQDLLSKIRQVNLKYFKKDRNPDILNEYYEHVDKIIEERKNLMNELIEIDILLIKKELLVKVTNLAIIEASIPFLEEDK